MGFFFFYVSILHTLFQYKIARQKLEPPRNGMWGTSPTTGARDTGTRIDAMWYCCLSNSVLCTKIRISLFFATRRSGQSMRRPSDSSVQDGSGVKMWKLQKIQKKSVRRRRRSRVQRAAFCVKTRIRHGGGPSDNKAWRSYYCNAHSCLSKEKKTQKREKKNDAKNRNTTVVHIIIYSRP